MKKIKAYRCEMSGQPSYVHALTMFAATELEAMTMFVEWYTETLSETGPDGFTVEEIRVNCLPFLERRALREALLDQEEGVGVREVLDYHFVIRPFNRAGRLAMERFGSPSVEGAPEDEVL